MRKSSPILISGSFCNCLVLHKTLLPKTGADPCEGHWSPVHMAKLLPKLFWGASTPALNHNLEQGGQLKNSPPNKGQTRTFHSNHFALVPFHWSFFPYL